MCPATPKDIEREKRALAKIARAKLKLDRTQERLARCTRKQEQLEEKIARYEDSLRHTAKSSFRFGGEHILVRIAAEIRFDGVRDRKLEKILADNLDRQDQEYGAKDSKFWNTAMENIFYPEKANDYNGFHLIQWSSNLSKSCVAAIFNAVKQDVVVPPWQVLNGPMPGVIAAIRRLEFYMDCQEKNPTRIGARIHTATDALQSAIVDVLSKTEPMVVTDDMIFEQNLTVMDADAELLAATAYREALHAA